MSMQKQLSIRDGACRPITALGYHPSRREVITGCADGVIKWWDIESGKLSIKAAKHSGMVTSFLYWEEAKLLLSASNDGTVLAWTTGATIYDKIEMGRPVFSMAINLRRHQLVCGFKSRIVVYPLDENRTSGHIIRMSESSTDRRHKDIVSCIVCHDAQIYTGGYDRRFIVFDTSSYPKENGLTAVQCNSSAHEAGITALLLVKESENTRLLTGSFDNAVCIWSQDGQLIQKLSFSGVITGLCYASCVDLVWIACRSPFATLLEPKSGEIASDFIDTFQKIETGPRLERLLYLAENNSVVGTAGHNHVIVWKWKKARSTTVLQNRQSVDCLAYTMKKPILLFSGHSDGSVTKWERMNSSNYIYSKESFKICEHVQKARSQSHSLKPKKNTNAGEKSPGAKLRRSKSSDGTMVQDKQNEPSSFTRSVFVEELDLLALSSENGRVYLWGFDDSLSSIVKLMPNQSSVCPETRKKFHFLLDQASESQSKDSSGEEDNPDAATNRVSGFSCKKVLLGHFQSVSALAVVGKGSPYNTVFLISGGWDRRLCVWDLKKGVLQDTFSNADLENWHEFKEVACDGAILDLAYSPKRNEFAYSSSDGLIYLRQFSPVGREMKLINVMRGHESDVTAVIWHHSRSQWISGSEDSTIRIWSENGMQCENILFTNGAVGCLAFDHFNGCLLAGVLNVLRVYDLDSCLQVQSRHGHTDTIRAVLHIPERNQYITGSSDKTIQMWNTYSKSPP
ncbi:uncharacterized protein [Lepisosteus oculatus]|uniref:uncharacterized protein n=1 Tax=Lepisosteus oculatus TaxID=7918 RepID=UPI0035F5267A